MKGSGDGIFLGIHIHRISFHVLMFSVFMLAIFEGQYFPNRKSVEKNSFFTSLNDELNSSRIFFNKFQVVEHTLGFVS